MMRELPNEIILYIYSYLNGGKKEKKQNFKKISKRFYNLFYKFVVH